MGAGLDDVDDEVAAFAMTPVGPPLDPYVAGIWQMRGLVPVAAETVLPNGVVEVMFNFGPPASVVEVGLDGCVRVRVLHRSWVAGMQQGPLTITSQGSLDVLGVRFKPGGLRAVLGVPLHELTDRVVELEALDRSDAMLGGLWEQLVMAAPGQRVAMLEEVLGQQLVRRAGGEGFLPDLRVAVAVAALPKGVGVAELARQVGVSHKHLIDRFHSEVGVGPSRFRRILRFDAAVRLIAHDAAPPWALVAARAGFSDQSHLIREFQAFAGVTPTEFVRARLPDQAHFAVGPADVPTLGVNSVQDGQREGWEALGLP